MIKRATKVPSGARSKGQEIVEGLQELATALSAGEPLSERFTVRTYRIAPPPTYMVPVCAGFATCWE